MSEEESNLEKDEEQLNDITECSICTETFKEPKILPCSHTFCKNCLKSLATKLEKSSGDDIPCPMCRKKFVIPEKGFDGLQKNFFMERLTEMTITFRPSSENIFCEACLDQCSSEPSVNESELSKAEVYCTDCQQRLCKECHRYHLKNKILKTHKLLSLNELRELGKSKVAITMTKSCDKHERKPLDIYCFDCEDVVCSSCRPEEHESHETSTVDSAVDTFRIEMLDIVNELDECTTELQVRRIKLHKYKKDFIQRENQLVIEINKTRENLRTLIDAKSDALLSILKNSCEKSLKSLESSEEEIDTLITKTESYKTDCDEMATIGSASNICKDFERMQTEAEELRELCESQMEIENAVEFPFPQMMNKLSQETVDPLIIQLVGEFEDPINQIYMAQPKSSAKFESVSVKSSPASTNSKIFRMTIMENELITAVQVIENKVTSYLFELYDLRTLFLKQMWRSERLTNLIDMHSHPTHNCAYALTTLKNLPEIVRFTSNNKILGSWSVSDKDGKLSVTEESVLLTSSSSKRLHEFSLQGQFLRVIELSRYCCLLSRLYHAIKLKSDRYVIGCSGKLIIIGSDGKTLKEITKVGESTVLNEPVHLVKGRDNNVIVAELGALMVLNSNLEEVNANFVQYPPYRSDQKRAIIDELNKRVFVMKYHWQEFEVLHF